MIAVGLSFLCHIDGPDGVKNKEREADVKQFTTSAEMIAKDMGIWSKRIESIWPFLP